MLNFKSTSHLFDQNIKYLKSISSFVEKLESKNLKIDSSRLAAAANRFNVPRPFEPYVKYVVQATKRAFPQDIYFTKEEVIKTDEAIIKSFRTRNFDTTKIVKKYLIMAAIDAAKQLGLDQLGEMTRTDVRMSANSFEGNTSSGYPIFKKKYTEEATEDAIKWASMFLIKPDLIQLLMQPTAVFHRFQYKVRAGARDVYDIVKKIRPIWGISYRVLCLESTFFRYIIDNLPIIQLTSNEPCTASGRTKFQMSKDVIARFRRHNGKIVSVDYDKFDSTVSNFMWALFYAIVLQLFNQKEDHKILKHLMAFHCYTPYCWRSTVLKFQRQGIPSGSLITNLFGTFVNLTMYNYACLERSNGKRSGGTTCCATGDDLTFIDKYTNLIHLSSVAKRFGCVISTEKSDQVNRDETFSFMGYLWDTQNRPFQLEQWYIAHLCMPSRFFAVTDIPISLLQTYRGVSVCMGLYRGMDMFEHLVGWADTVWHSIKQKFHQDGEAFIEYIGEDQRMMRLKIPLSIIYNEGWETL